MDAVNNSAKRIHNMLCNFIMGTHFDAHSLVGLSDAALHTYMELNRMQENDG